MVKKNCILKIELVAPEISKKIKIKAKTEKVEITFSR